MLADLFARFLARRLVRWALIGLFNLIGFASVAGIPVVVIVDILLVLTALQGIFAALRVAFAAAGSVAVKLFKVAAVGAVVCCVAGLVLVMVLPRSGAEHAAQALPVASAAVQAAVQSTLPAEGTVALADAPAAAQAQDGNGAPPVPAPAPAPTAAPGAREVIALIDERNYAGALALIDAGADVAAALDGRTALTALALDNRPHYYGESDGYRLMKRLIPTSAGLDRRLNEFGSILWHQLLYEVQNDPQRFEEVLDLLLARGIDINQKNFHGQTLADTATWPYADQDIMVARGACGRLPNPVKPAQAVCAN